MRRVVIGIVAAGLPIALSAGGSPAATLVVFPDGSGDAPTIQAAIDEAVDGDSVALAPGIFRGPGNRTLAFRGKAITLTSRDGPEATILDCENTRACTFVEGETPATVLSGITIRNGAGYEVVNCFRSSPTIHGNVFSNCQGLEGSSVIEISYGAPSVTDNTFLHNESVAAIHAILALPRIAGNRFDWNLAGVWSEYSGGTIEGNVFTNHTYGVFLDTASPDVLGNVFTDNRRGVYIHDASPNFIHNTLHGNRAPASRWMAPRAPSSSGTSWRGRATDPASCANRGRDRTSSAAICSATRLAILPVA